MATYKQPQPVPCPGPVNKDQPKTTGVKTRGNGAATKGVTARGPLA